MSEKENQGDKPTKDREYDEYWRLVDLWRFYLDLIIKVNVFFAGIAGGLVAYVLQRAKDVPTIQAALVPPFLLSIGFFIMTFIGIFQSNELATSISTLASKIDVKQPLHADLLRNAMILTSIFYLLCTLGIGALPFIHRSLIAP